jgi:hypothetical protein
MGPDSSAARRSSALDSRHLLMDIYDHSHHKNRNWIWPPRFCLYVALCLYGIFFCADVLFTPIFHLHAGAVYVRSRASPDLLFNKTDKKVFRKVIYLSPIFLRDQLTDVSRCSEIITHHFKHALP